jgi:dolichol-phosphate mannosyltransferase
MSRISVKPGSDALAEKTIRISEFEGDRTHSNSGFHWNSFESSMPTIPVPLAWLPTELTVVIPTFNERENVPILLERLSAVLTGIAWEAVFVDDDSPDGTADLLRAFARKHPNVRCLQRIGRRGLASACVEGVLSSAAPYVAIMDADLQHDETLLPKMLEALRTERLGIVIGSRFAGRGDCSSMSRFRAKVSGFGNRLARLVVKAELTDPMSGFFMLQRPVFDAAVRRLSAQGFKILVDIFASSPELPAFKELGFTFRERLHGQSKLDTLVAFEYVRLLIDKLIGHIIPVQFVLFGTIGFVGLAVHLSVLGTCLKLGGLSFVTSQGVATITAMTWNFYLNNILTYRDRRLRGKKWLYGLLSFYALCSIGAFANVGIAAYLFRADGSWRLAGITGALIGAVSNYALSSVLTWRPVR